MKKLLTASIFCAFMLTLVSCGNDKCNRCQASSTSATQVEESVA